MEKILRQKDLVSEIADRTHFFKKNVQVFLDALEEIIIENMMEATEDERSELHLARGIVLGGKRVPERVSRDPRNQEKIIVEAKVLPYAKFTTSLRNDINEEDI